MKFPNIFNLFKSSDKKKVISVNDLPNYHAYSGQKQYSNWDYSIYDGEKFPGGYGLTQIPITDYWTLRKRSQALFNQNLYARGVVRRLITNEINTGLMPEARPDEEIIGLPEDSLSDWTESIENRFGIWASNPKLCDYYGQDTFGSLQRKARQGALVDGDMLVVLRQSRISLPQIQLISGDKVRSPVLPSESNDIPENHYLKHGVEYDAKGRVYAYWVFDNEKSTYERLLAYGSRSKRRIAWLIFGTDKLYDDCRGQPLLSIVMQSLQEIDRYRDSTQRKATNNSMIAALVEKTQDKIASLPITGGATRKDTATVSDADGSDRDVRLTRNIPGMVFEDLQVGETVKLMNGDGTDLNFGDFEASIVQGMAWALEIPPEILRLSFSNNYSASQAAINEFKIYLNKIWSDFGETFCTPVYQEWLLSETLLGKIDTGNMLEAWRDPMMYDVYGAWVACDWYGSIKPSTDMLKQAKGSKLLVDDGWSTNAREARITTGTKFSKNMKRLKRENQLKVEAMRPLMEFKKEFNIEDAPNDTDIDDIVENPTAKEDNVVNYSDYK